MSRWMAAAACALLFCTSPLYGEGPPRQPETLLAKECLGYLKLEGLAHGGQGFNQTALAELLRGDTGLFLQHLAQLIQDELGPGTVKTKLQAGVPPAQLMKIHAAAARLPHLATYVYHHGLVLGFEYVSLLPPQAQLTIICPQGGLTGHREAILAAIELYAALESAKLESATVSGRQVTCLSITEMLTLRCWAESEHLVITIGNATPEHTISLVEGKRANLTANEQFQNLAKAVPYDTYLRGFIDAERSLKLVKLAGKEAEKMVEDLGLFGLKSITLHMGCTGKQTRTSLVLHTAAERKGLLKLCSAKGSSGLGPLPPMPPDANGVTAFNVDLAEVYDTLRQAIEQATPTENAEVRETFKKLDQTLGLSVRKDLLETLGSRIVFYSSGGEGIFGLGVGCAIQVKDAKKLRASATTLMASAPSALDANVRFSQRDVAGVTVHTMQKSQNQGFALAMAPSYAVTEDWVVIGLFPQTVHGFLYRSSGKVTAWKHAPALEEVVAKAQKNPHAKVLAFSQTDPRTTLRDLASIGPFFIAQIGAFGESSFDPTLIPQYQVVTEPLFPNVGLIVDEGTAVRVETYSSIGIPFDALGLHAYWFPAIIGANF